MADIDSIVRSWGRLGNGGIIQKITGIMPASATATVPVGELTSYDDVNVKYSLAVTGNAVPLIEIAASRTTGETGVITIGTQDGSAPGATANVVVDILKLVG
jgi:hypothetical protein